MLPAWSSDQTKPDRVALVTGAARGIGAATVLGAVPAGLAVTALDVCSGGNVLPGVGYHGQPGQPRGRCPGSSRTGCWPSSPTCATGRPRVGGQRHPGPVRAPGRRRRGGRRRGRRAVPVGDPGGAPADAAGRQRARGVEHRSRHRAGACSPGRLPARPASSPWPRQPASVGCSSSPATSRASTPSSASSGVWRRTCVGTGVAAIAVPRAPRTPHARGHRRPLRHDAGGAGRAAGDPAAHRPEEIAATIALCCSPAGAALNGSVIRPTAASAESEWSRAGRSLEGPAGAELVRQPCPGRSRGVRRR